MEKYDFKEIESKWQKIWDKEKDLFHGEDNSAKPKHYHLIEFPYPSGAGLHVGHCMGYGASDAYSRMKRMQGYNVMFPIGWDAFGLPTENFAIKTGRKPAEVTKENTDVFRKQMKSLGLSFDWDREINTTDPNYFKWTQWIFLQFYKHAVIDGKLVEVADEDVTTPRLAYQSQMPINWCPSCKIGLANEEVVAGRCERCESEVVKKMQKQWMLRITSYADRLIKDLDTVQYLDKIKTQQVNWIGKSTGTNIKFRIKKETILDPRVTHLAHGLPRRKPEDDEAESIEVFTTRADTLFGCTYIVIAPESDYLSNLKPRIKNLKEVETYIEQARKKSDMERTELAKEKTGVKLEGVTAINPINNEEVDIYVADYVLANYGTGAVMAVPAHDERDWEFAKKYNIPIKEVIIPKVVDTVNPPIDGKETVIRRAIQAIIIDPKNNKVLCLKWKKFPWTTFITGGVDENEDIVDAAKREIKEETGYDNLKYIRTLGGPVESHFFAAHKGVNRKAIFSALVFEISESKPLEINDEEKSIHELSWNTWDEITHDKNLTCCEYSIWLDRFFNEEHAFCDYGVLINSGEFDGLSSEEGKKKITEKLKSIGAGDFTINYKLRDWIFSRQHYWGEPIPIIHCEKCGTVPLDESELPVLLPDVENYQPTNTGESPLSDIADWVNVKCPKCGGSARRETDTMPNWAGSSWYYLAYAMQGNSKQAGNIFEENTEKLKYWMPVDLYNGGMEHTTLHLLYSRFWNKFLYDLGVAPTSEPYQKRIAHGIILGSDGRKMSKSFGNTINPDDIVSQLGADTTRAYIMFIGPYDGESAWSTAGAQGVYRFLTRVYKNLSKISNDHIDSKPLLIKLNQTIVGVTEDIENFRFNTVVSKLMELNNAIEKENKISKSSFSIFIKLLAPVVPHLAHEMWEEIGESGLVCQKDWPKEDKEYLAADQIEIVVQVNGKIRDKIVVPADITDEDLKKTAMASEKVKQNVDGHEIVKTIVVPKKLVSIVIR